MSGAEGMGSPLSDRPGGSDDDALVMEAMYARYATTHSGLKDEAVEAVIIRRQILPLLSKHDAGGQDIVDVGCGQGGAVRALRSLGFIHTRGIDRSPEQVDIARGAGTVGVQCADYREWLPAEGPFDALLALDLLEHLSLPELYEFGTLACRSLRAGGRLVVRSPNGASPTGGIYQYGDLTHRTVLSPRSFVQLMRTVGFADVGVQPVFPPVHGMKSGMRAGLARAVAAGWSAVVAVETGERRAVVTPNFVGWATVAGDAATGRAG